MRLRRVIAIALLVLASPGALAWAQAPRPTVKIGYLPTDSFAALFVMAERYLPEAGVNVETVRLAGGPEILSQVVTGQLQVGGAGMGAAGFNAVAAGLPVEYIAPLHSGYIEDYFTVRKAVWGKEVKRVADLKGRTVALNIRGAAVEWMLEQALKQDGLTIKDVQIRLMPFPDMVPALESGAVDAGILSEPFPTLAEEKGVGVRPLPRPAGAKATPITAVFWNKDWAAANPDLAHRVMVAFLRAARDLALGDGWKQGRNIEVILKYTTAKAEVLKKARPHVLDPNLEMDPGVLESMQRFNADLGYLKYKELLPVTKLFNFAYRDRAVRELGRK
ncbi:MAG: ABC transporter substrate-binding protein [Candidatus Rokubacteria bacterium]|nr:ABC transporter substrate-binding protein [Candidatus Rokubacteria bacterium]